MAPKSVIGHEHCGVCGACLLHLAQLHRCPAHVDMEVLALFILDTRTIAAKSMRPRGSGPDDVAGINPARNFTKRENKKAFH